MPRQSYRRGFRTLTVTLRLSMVVGMLLMGSGCVSLELTKPPLIDLQSLDRDPYIKKITVKNGEGETLYEGVPGQISANPPLAQLDGTLVITHQWSDGRTEMFVLGYEAWARVNAGWNSSEGKYEIKQPGPVQVGIAGGFGQIEGTRFGIGTVDKGGKEQSLAKNGDRVDTKYVHAHLSNDFGPKGVFSGTRLYLRVDYLWGEDKDSAREEIGGNAVAVTYEKSASSGAPTAIDLQMTGGKARSENDVKGIDLNLGASGDLTLGEGLTLTPNINLSYRGFWQRGWG